MKKLTALLLALGLLTGCGAEKGVPQTAEEIDTFDEVLAFVSGQTDVDVTDVQVLKESGLQARMEKRQEGEDLILTVRVTGAVQLQST